MQNSFHVHTATNRIREKGDVFFAAQNIERILKDRGLQFGKEIGIMTYYVPHDRSNPIKLSHYYPLGRRGSEYNTLLEKQGIASTAEPVAASLLKKHFPRREITIINPIGSRIQQLKRMKMERDRPYRLKEYFKIVKDYVRQSKAKHRKK